MTEWLFSQSFLAKDLLKKFRKRMHRNPESVEEVLKVLRIPSIQHESVKKSFKALEKQRKQKQKLLKGEIKGL